MANTAESHVVIDDQDWVCLVAQLNDSGTILSPGALWNDYFIYIRNFKLKKYHLH